MRNGKQPALWLAVALSLVLLWMSVERWGSAGAQESYHGLPFAAPASIAQGTVADPRGMSPRMVHLPALNGSGGPEDYVACRTAIDISSLGNLPTRAVLVYWGEAYGCGEEPPGPIDVDCTGLLSPGSTWTLHEGQIPAAARSAAIFSLADSRAFPTPSGPRVPPSRPTPENPCVAMFVGLRNQAQNYDEFRRAYERGEDWRGIDMQKDYGSPLSVMLYRECDNGPAGRPSQSVYAGLPASGLSPQGGRTDPDAERLTYRLPIVAGWPYSGTYALQNAGADCAEIEISVFDGRLERECSRRQLSSGEAGIVDLVCLREAGIGASLILRSSQPLALVYDQRHGLGFGSDRINLQSGQVLQAGLPLSPSADWISELFLQNQDSGEPADVRVALLDASGRALGEHLETISAGASAYLDLRALAPTDGRSVHSLSVTSLPRSVAEPAELSGILRLRRGGPLPDGSDEPLELSLLPLSASSLRPETQQGVVALPRLEKNLSSGSSMLVTIANHTAAPGFAHVAAYVYDQNGLLDFWCYRLEQGQVERLDSRGWSMVNDGFRGSMVVSAARWHHETVEPGSGQAINPIGLAASAVALQSGLRVVTEETLAYAGQGIPLDEPEIFVPGGFKPICPSSRPPTAVPEFAEIYLPMLAQR